jgi:hypothetical protein
MTAFDAVQRLFQSMRAVEQNGGKSLVPSRGRNAFFDSQVSQEAVEIAFRQLPGMLVFVELDVPANPVEAGLFRAATVVVNPQNIDSAVVETRHRLVGKQAEGRSVLLRCCRHGPGFAGKTELFGK